MNVLTFTRSSKMGDWTSRTPARKSMVMKVYTIAPIVVSIGARRIKLVGHDFERCSWLADDGCWYTDEYIRLYAERIKPPKVDKTALPREGPKPRR